MILLLGRIGMRSSCFSEFNLLAIILRYLGLLELSTGFFLLFLMEIFVAQLKVWAGLICFFNVLKKNIVTIVTKRREPTAALYFKVWVS